MVTPRGRRPRDSQRDVGATAKKAGLLDGIVRGLAGDHDVVHMAFAQPGAADADEARLLQELGNCGAATVAHAGLQSSNHLVDDHRDRAAVGNASLNAFWDHFGKAVGIAFRNRSRGLAFWALEVALARP